MTADVEHVERDLKGLDDIFQKLSVGESILDASNEDADQNVHLFNHIYERCLQYLESNQAPHILATERIKKLIFHPDQHIRDENRLELTTVFTIIKIVEHIQFTLNEPLTQDVVRKNNALLFSLFGSFKYYFQLPINHNNYAFRNFGFLLSSQRMNVIVPFVKYMKQSGGIFYELNKSEILEKSFIMLLIFHCFNNDMFKFLSETFTDNNFANEIFYNFNLKSVKTENATIPSIFSIYQRFRTTSLLENSTLINDSKSANLLNILFFSSFHKLFLVEFIENIIKFKSLFTEPEIDLFALSSKICSSSNGLDYLTIILTNDIDCLNKIDSFVKGENQSQSDMAAFILLKVSQTYLSNFNLFQPLPHDFNFLVTEYSNSNYLSILGLSENALETELNISTFIPIFEFVDQNLKLDYIKERDYLLVLKLAFITLNLNLDSMVDFMNINSLLVDIGCSLSINSLIDTIQTLLCIVINEIKFQPGTFNKIPSKFKDFLGLDYIPPVYRSDMSFENNINLQVSSFGSTFKMLQEITDHPIFIESESQKLLEDCLTLSLSVKSKIFKFLKNINNETNVLRVPDLFLDENKLDDYQLSIFKQSISTRIGSFKSSKSLNYKLLNSSILLNIISNLSLLIVGENYKYLKSSEFILDNSISRFLNDFTIDFSLTFLIIYQEFGLLNFFKELRTLNQQNLKLILPSSILVSRLFQVKNSESSSLNPDHSNTAVSTVSSFDIISELLYKSVVASNLLRQFVELFDDGQSRPFKSLNKFLKIHPSTLKPSKISKGTVTLNINDYQPTLCLRQATPRTGK